MTVPLPVTAGRIRFEGLKKNLRLCYFSFPSFIHPSCPLFHCVVMRLTKVFPSFTFFSSTHVRSIWSVSFSPPASFSVCHLRPVMRLTANLSSSLILSPPLLSVSFSLILSTSMRLLYFHPLSSLSPSVVSHFLPSAPVQPVMRLTSKASRLLQHTGLTHMVH